MYPNRNYLAHLAALACALGAGEPANATPIHDPADHVVAQPMDRGDIQPHVIDQILNYTGDHDLGASDVQVDSAAKIKVFIKVFIKAMPYTKTIVK